jgi:hypothetical protein
METSSQNQRMNISNPASLLSAVDLSDSSNDGIYNFFRATTASEAFFMLKTGVEFRKSPSHDVGRDL